MDREDFEQLRNKKIEEAVFEKAVEVADEIMIMRAQNNEDTSEKKRRLLILMAVSIFENNIEIEGAYD